MTRPSSGTTGLSTCGTLPAFCGPEEPSWCGRQVEARRRGRCRRFGVPGKRRCRRTSSRSPRAPARSMGDQADSSPGNARCPGFRCSVDAARPCASPRYAEQAFLTRRPTTRSSRRRQYIGARRRGWVNGRSVHLVAGDGAEHRARACGRPASVVGDTSEPVCPARRCRAR